MKAIILLLVSIKSLNVFSQTPDFAAIEKNVNDSNSNYFYDKLAYQFRLDPGMLDSVGVQHLYYGKVFIKNQPKLFDKDYMEAREQMQKLNFKKAIAAAEKMILKDPTNLEMLGVLIRALEKQEPDSRYLPLYKFQAKRIIDCFVTSGDGKADKTPYYVTSVSDSHILMDIKGKNPYSFKRTSRNVPKGMMDIYKNGDEAIYITVLYNFKNEKT